MNHFAKSRRRFYALSLPACALAFLGSSAGRASAQVEGADILYHYNSSTVEATPQQPGTPLSELFNRIIGQPFPGAAYENDTGMDVTPGFDAGYVDANGNTNAFQFSKVVVQQTAISPGLSAFYQFDGVTPVFGANPDSNDASKPIGFWELTEDNVLSNANSSDPFAHALGIRGSAQLYAGDDSDPVKRYFHQHFIFEADNPGTYLFNYTVTGTLLDGTELAPVNFAITYTPQVADVPEPGVIALLAAGGLSGLGLLRRQRGKRA